MNGAGTQENPYIIMNADDLYSMETLGGSQVYFAMGNNIDLNNSRYAEKFTPIPLNCKRLAGNDFVIRNVNYSDPLGSVSVFSILNEDENSDITVDGLRIENIRLSGKNVFVFGNAGNTECNLYLEHCTFTLNDITFTASETFKETTGYCLMHDDGITVSADYCTFVVSVYFSKVQPVFSGDTISHSQLKFELNAHTLAGSSEKYNMPMLSVTVSDSYFFITVDRKNGTSTESMNFSSSDSIFSGCYMVCEIINGISLFMWNGIIGNICFYDKSVISKNVQSASVRNGNSSYMSKVIGLTTEQCKDAVYLRSIGFNCAEG